MKLTVRAECVYPPIPDRRYDWQAIAEEYYDDATDAGWVPIGRAATKFDAIADLLEQIRAHEED